MSSFAPLICKRAQSTVTNALSEIKSSKQLFSPSTIPFINSQPSVTFTSRESKRQRRRLLERPGLIGVKRGMTCYFDNQGRRLPATILEIIQNEVTFTRTVEKEGIYSIQIGSGYQKPQNVTKPMLGHFRNAKVSPKEFLKDFQVMKPENLLELGTELKADHFQIGQLVDVISVTKGKGMAGVMKRWNFSGGNATHGASLSHRSAGSTGQNTTPARVLPGKKMAGRLGNERNTIFNLEVLDLNAEKGYILVKGCVSGSKGSFVEIRDALKKYGKHLINEEK
ncbi:54S ribosomal protein L9, mitochondrial [Pichia californica]|uniref:Large ribosomal subunit protein uL3m n=1 Tax=Pichia californica TaxID=460514 RepID=A0A9P6WH09_9ASCO|nr:54S ribosomal protein L9, mitochondrial [[Candida] californica]KAG0686980.1 54S ribosomal protein L9, mitochondrial [[Candida] californica]